jgi:Thioredoxin
MSIRLDIVAGLVVALLVAGALYGQYRARGASDRDQDRAPLPRLPDQLVAGVASTWVVFTTRYCATCEPVCQRLRTAYPDAAVVKVDAAERPDLARAFRIQRAPTALLADPHGAVTARLVGPEAVDDYLRARV